MIELDYVDKQFDVLAAAALDKGDPIVVPLPAKSAASIKKALLLYSSYFDLRQKGKRDRILLVRFGWYGIRTPTLWGVIFKAKLMGREVSTYEIADQSFLTIGGASQQA